MPPIHTRAKTSLAPVGVLLGAPVACFLLLLGARSLFPLPVEHSTPVLIHEPGGNIAVELDLTSHLAQPTHRILRISLGHAYAGRTHGSGVSLREHQDVSIALAPAETRRVRCEFPDAARTNPDCAEVTFLP